jgi:Protein of unknown function (DUF2815)
MANDNKAYIHDKTGNIVTPKGRILWNELFQPRKAKGGKDGKYEFNLLIPKTADIAVMKEQALEAGKAKFPKLFKDAAGKWPSSVKSPFKKTAENDKIAELADDYPMFFAARSKDRPGVVAPNGKSEGVEPEHVYAGRWAKASVQAFAYETDGNKGVTFGLINVQLLDSDEELVIGGGRVSAESEFEAADAADGDRSASQMFD